MKLIGEKALTPAQKMQRQRMKHSLKVQAAKNNGYVPMTVFMSVKQLSSIEKFLSLRNFEEIALDGTTVNDAVFKGLKMLLSHYEVDAKEQGYSQKSIDKCAYSDDKDEDYLKLLRIEISAQNLFQEWEVSQLSQPKEESQ